MDDSSTPNASGSAAALLSGRLEPAGEPSLFRVAGCVHCSGRIISAPNRRSLEPRFKIENGRIHRFGRPCWVKIFPKVRDLIASGTQEHNVLLAINAAGGLDQSFGLDLRHGGLWVCKRIDFWIN